MRVCTKCSVPKHEDDFYWKDQSKGRRHPYCKTCDSEAKKRHYRKNKGKYIRRVRANKVARRFEVFKYLCFHPCVDCGECDPVVLDFDHQDRKSKIRCVSQMAAEGCSWETIMAEISKCVVRCAKCHRKKTAKENGFQDLADQWIKKIFKIL